MYGHSIQTVTLNVMKRNVHLKSKNFTHRKRLPCDLFMVKCAGMGGRFPECPLVSTNDENSWMRPFKASKQIESLKMELKLKNFIQEEKCDRLCWSNVPNVTLEATDNAPKILVTSKDNQFSLAYDLEAQLLGFNPLRIENVYTFSAEASEIPTFGKIWKRMAGLRLVVSFSKLKYFSFSLQ